MEPRAASSRGLAATRRRGRSRLHVAAETRSARRAPQAAARQRADAESSGARTLLAGPLRAARCCHDRPAIEQIVLLATLGDEASSPVGLVRAPVALVLLAVRQHVVWLHDDEALQVNATPGGTAPRPRGQKPKAPAAFSSETRRASSPWPFVSTTGFSPRVRTSRTTPGCVSGSPPAMIMTSQRRSRRSPLARDLREVLHSRGIVALVAVLAAQVAAPRRLEPREAIVRHRPGHAVKRGGVDRGERRGSCGHGRGRVRAPQEARPSRDAGRSRAAPRWSRRRRVSRGAG